MSIFRVPFQVCFDAQGWERGQKIFFDQLALQYPQINECDLFNGTDLTHRDPGQKCSIAEEVANGREVADCTNKLQVGLFTSERRQASSESMDYGCQMAVVEQ